MKRVKPFNCRGSRWQYKGKSSLGDKYITIKRDVIRSLLQKGKGQVVTAIDVLKEEIR